MWAGFWTLVQQSESDPRPKRLCPSDGQTGNYSGPEVGIWKPFSKSGGRLTDSQPFSRLFAYSKTID